MEEAYQELYQQFLRLRSLCLKQAAMLHQLTTALQKHQGLCSCSPRGLFPDFSLKIWRSSAWTQLITSDPYLVNECLSPSGGALLSEVALQSHVCEFCQAVFPGETSTRGDFLRHLHTHVA
uniref:Uncharacterized protein n=1 Tax=Oryzias sinensis TaxID=183150 RepID=A0A8C8DT03_9TELE